MNEEPFFIVNEFLEQEKKQIGEIINYLDQGSKESKTINKAIFLRNFSNLLFNAYRNQKDKTKTPEVIEVKINHEKLQLLNRKKELLNKLNQLNEKTIKEREMIIISKAEYSEPVMSKLTKKPLAIIRFENNKYIIEEPKITEEDKNIIKGLEESIAIYILEQPDVLRGLLKQKLGREISENYFDSLRYYLIRDLKDYKEISPLINDLNVREIVCKGADEKIIVTYKDQLEVETNLVLNEESLNKLINYIAKRSKLELTEESPFLNVTLNNLKIQANITTEIANANFVIDK